MTTLEALLFDVDGTLADTEELHRRAFNQTFLEFGLGWDWAPDRYRALLGISGGAARIARHIDELDVPALDKSRLRQLIPALHREKTRHYGELLGGSGATLRPGIGRLVEEARRAGLRLGLAATSARANVESLVAAAFGSKARDSFAAIIAAELVARKKPAPDIYTLLLRSLRVSAAACVAFEDSANGLGAAKAAGLWTVVTPTQWTVGQDFTAADLRLPMLGDPGKPLDPSTAASIGGPWLGLAELRTLRASRRPAAGWSAA
jgi:beta-phosphoglucomutase-like phosphatase (HAD superfamily)